MQCRTFAKSTVPVRNDPSSNSFRNNTRKSQAENRLLTTETDGRKRNARNRILQQPPVHVPTKTSLSPSLSCKQRRLPKQIFSLTYIRLAFKSRQKAESRLHQNRGTATGVHICRTFANTNLERNHFSILQQAPPEHTDSTGPSQRCKQSKASEPKM